MPNTVTLKEMNARWRGYRKGYLHILKVTERKHGHWYCLCRCHACGKVVEKTVNAVRQTSSCGCIQGRKMPATIALTPGTDLTKIWPKVIQVSR